MCLFDCLLRCYKKVLLSLPGHCIIVVIFQCAILVKEEAIFVITLFNPLKGFIYIDSSFLFLKPLFFSPFHNFLHRHEIEIENLLYVSFRP